MEAHFLCHLIHRAPSPLTFTGRVVCTYIFAFLERLKLLSSSTITLSQSRYFTRSRCKCQSRTRSTRDPLSRLRTDDSPSEIDYSLREKIVLLRRNFSYTLCRFVSNECLTTLDHGNVSCQNHVGIHTLLPNLPPKSCAGEGEKGFRIGWWTSMPKVDRENGSRMFVRIHVFLTPYTCESCKSKVDYIRLPSRAVPIFPCSTISTKILTVLPYTHVPGSTKFTVISSDIY